MSWSARHRWAASVNSNNEITELAFPALCEYAYSRQDRPYAKLDAARNIKIARLEAGLNQVDFARRLGVDPNDFIEAEFGDASYQQTMDMSDRVSAVLDDSSAISSAEALKLFYSTVTDLARFRG